MTLRRKNKNKNNRGLLKLRDKLLALHGQSTSIGYFKEQGLHPTADMPYASLAYIHAHGHEFGYPTRDIFKHMKPVIGGYPLQAKFFRNLLKSYVQIKSSYTLENLLDDIGKRYRDDGKNIFGNTAFLEQTSNPTPLVDEGFLKDAFAYKTTFNYKVRPNG